MGIFIQSGIWNKGSKKLERVVRRCGKNVKKYGVDNIPIFVYLRAFLIKIFPYKPLALFTFTKIIAILEVVCYNKFCAIYLIKFKRGVSCGWVCRQDIKS